MIKSSKILFVSLIIGLFSFKNLLAFEVQPVGGGQQSSTSSGHDEGASEKKDTLQITTWGGGSDSGFMYQYNNFMFGFQGTLVGSDGNPGAEASADLTSRSKTVFEDRQSNRVMMGMSVDGGPSFYGFAGLAESFLANSYDYHDANMVEGRSCQTIKRRSYCSTFSATQEAMGYAEDKGWYDGHVMGAGLQYPMFGGMLRLEYTYSDYGVIQDKMEVVYRVSDKRVKANAPGYKDVSWDTEDHTTYVKWGLNF